MPHDLRPFPLAEAMAAIGKPGSHVVTMSEDQWDWLLSGAYEAGCILLELDDDEVPVRAYCKEGVR